MITLYVQKNARSTEEGPLRDGQKILQPALFTVEGCDDIIPFLSPWKKTIIKGVITVHPSQMIKRRCLKNAPFTLIMEIINNGASPLYPLSMLLNFFLCALKPEKMKFYQIRIEMH